jgi:hypothetical protein
MIGVGSLDVNADSPRLRSLFAVVSQRISPGREAGSIEASLPPGPEALNRNRIVKEQLKTRQTE